MVAVVLISGSSGSGKSTIARGIVDSFPKTGSLFQQDNYFTAPFTPYCQRSDDSYEDGSGIDWLRLVQDMEACCADSMTDGKSDNLLEHVVVVEGHMLGAASNLLFGSFHGKANLLVIVIQCTQHVCKTRRLTRRGREEKEWEELNEYFDNVVWPSYLKVGIPTMDFLRHAATKRGVKVLELDTNATDSLANNLEEVLDIIKQMKGDSYQHFKDPEGLDSQESPEEVWPSGSNLEGFAQHELISIRLDDDSGTKLDLECVSSLSPIDMIHLSNGTHDATGHTVWMGALLLCEALASNATAKASPTDSQGTFSFRGMFQLRRVLELGCGTGVGGLALLVSPLAWDARPSHVCFTDNDNDVLDLCRRNCQRNIPFLEDRSPKQQNNGVSILHLDWSGAPAGDWNGTSAFDVVLATDVLYDVGCLGFLLSTVSQNLVPSGSFVLAHVPRSCLPEPMSSGSETNGLSRDDNISYQEALERHVIDTALKHGLILSHTLRPDQIKKTNQRCKNPALNEVSLEDMEEAGAALFIFQKGG
jgi:uridine kinase/SAM-dependent methyltransferase